MKQGVLISIALLIAPNLFAAAPTTQPLKQFQVAPELMKWPAGPSPAYRWPDYPLKVPDLTLKTRSPEPKNSLPLYYLAGTTSNDISGPTQTWGSIKFNGGTGWARPAVLNGENTVVRDNRTGSWYLQQDMPQTITVPTQPSLQITGAQSAYRATPTKAK